MRHILALILSLILSASSLAAEQSDEEISRLIIGRWGGQDSVEEHLTIKGSETYQQDGTLITEVEVTPKEGNPIKIRVEGKWELKDAVLTSIATKTSHEAIMPVGTTTKDTILKIDSKELHYINFKGELSMEYRLEN